MPPIFSFLHFSYVARYGEDTLDITVWIENRPYLYIPIAGIPGGCVGVTLKSGAATSAGFINGINGIGVALSLPKIWPRATFDRIEVTNFHGSLAAFAHESKRTIKVENLDAIVRRREKASHKAGIPLFRGRQRSTHHQLLQCT